MHQNTTDQIYFMFTEFGASAPTTYFEVLAGDIPDSKCSDTNDLYELKTYNINKDKSELPIEMLESEI